MIRIRRSKDRGQADHGWLLAKHSFSFADYRDPEHMGFHALRVINEDRVQPAQGFGTHGHRDMEILTYVLDGVIEHKDNIGNHGRIRPGEVQVMSAGTGILHSEFNGSDKDVLHLLQIWIEPDEAGVTPRYAQAQIDADLSTGDLVCIAGPMDGPGKVGMHTQTLVYAARMQAGHELEHRLVQGNAWLQLAKGSVSVNGEPLQAGDGAAVDGVETITLAAGQTTELLLFDLP